MVNGEALVPLVAALFSLANCDGDSPNMGRQILGRQILGRIMLVRRCCSRPYLRAIGGRDLDLVKGACDGTRKAVPRPQEALSAVFSRRRQSEVYGLGE